MIRLMFAVLLLALCGGCLGSGPVAQTRPDQLVFPELQFDFPEVERIQLSNGMHIYLMEDHELPLVEMTLMIGGGSIEDPADKVGLAQLFAAGLESGGAGDLSPAALETELEALAVELSVSSASYHYSIDLSMQQRDLQRVVQILADILRRPRFDAERLELERQQLQESIRRRDDQPRAVAGRLLNEAAFPQHRFGRSPELEEVAKIRRDDLLRVQQRSLQPDNILLAVSGAVDREPLLNLLEGQFADWTARPQPDFVLPPLPPAPAGKVLLVDKDVPQTSIMLGHQGISKDNPDMFALQVANYILGGGGFNSRLMREIRSNRGLAYSVYSYFRVGRRLPELFVAASETKSSSTTEVVTLMLKMIRQLREEPVTEKELELAKQSLINSFVFAFSDIHSVVTRNARLDFFDYPEGYLESYRDRIAAVTVEDVQRVARQYLHPERLQIVLVGDVDSFADQLDGLDLPQERVEL